MGFVWFWIVAVMIALYVVLDGFDLGVGILSPFLGRSEDDRRTLYRSIGPVWDGNEVWLLAAGGALYFAFPLLYASSFSGFYLPLMMVLWLLMRELDLNRMILDGSAPEAMELAVVASLTSLFAIGAGISGFVFMLFDNEP